MKIEIDKKILPTLPRVEYNGKIHVVDDEAKTRQALDALSQETIVGIDTETRPSFRKHEVHNVALLQVSTKTECYLFRLNMIPIIPELIDFLENENLLKVGLSLRDDCNAMHRKFEFTPGGFLDLQNLVKDYFIADMSLQKIYAILFDRYISKGQRLTNWEAQTLTPEQQRYAAMDAWACLNIYEYLKSGAFVPEQSKYIVNEEEENQDETI